MASTTRGIASILLLSLLFSTTVSGDWDRPFFPRPRFRGPRFFRPRSPLPPSPSPPPPTPSPPPPAPVTCPIFPIRLLVCEPVVRDLRGGVQPPRFPCCTIINRLSDEEAKVCACTAGFRGFLGNVTIPKEITGLLIFCGKSVPANSTCT